MNILFYEVAAKWIITLEKAVKIWSSNQTFWSTGSKNFCLWAKWKQLLLSDTRRIFINLFLNSGFDDRLLWTGAAPKLPKGTVPNVSRMGLFHNSPGHPLNRRKPALQHVYSQCCPYWRGASLDPLQKRNCSCRLSSRDPTRAEAYLLDCDIQVVKKRQTGDLRSGTLTVEGLCTVKLVFWS